MVQFPRCSLRRHPAKRGPGRQNFLCLTNNTPGKNCLVEVTLHQRHNLSRTEPANAISQTPLKSRDCSSSPLSTRMKHPPVIKANYYNHQRERIARLSRFLLWPVKVTAVGCLVPRRRQRRLRSEEHTSELQSP